jgi:hypothetical protein
VSNDLGRLQQSSMAGQQTRSPRAHRSAVEVLDLDGAEPMAPPAWTTAIIEP